MKRSNNILAVIILNSTFLTACMHASQEKLSASKELIEVSRDSLELVFRNTFDEIEENLAIINHNKGGIIVLGDEGPLDIDSKKENILRRIQIINSLLETNDDIIEELEDLLAKEESRSGELYEKLSKTKLELKMEKIKISEVKDQLAQQEFRIGELNKKLDLINSEKRILVRAIDSIRQEKNKAYYAIGTFKELKENNVAEKEGGILGIGSTKNLKEDFNRQYFKSLDISEIKKIPIRARKAKILTEHPTGSYELENNESTIASLNIKDPEEFWRVNKYLVIEVK